MKYTLQIAFSEPVGDIILRVNEYAKKFGNEIAHCLNPLLFDFTDEEILLKRPEKNCSIADIAVFAMEIYNMIPLKWATKNKETKLKNKSDVEEFFEREFSNNIIEENNVDAEMHLMFYVPLYEPRIFEFIKYIVENLPLGHKFISNVIGITYDMAWSCNILPKGITKEECKENMINNINELAELTKLQPGHYNTLLKHIFLFQNYNLSGWSQNFTKNKLIDVCANLSLSLVEHYDSLCKYNWQDLTWSNLEKLPKPIIAINVCYETLDIYLAIDSIFRDLFKSQGQKEIINVDEIDKNKTKNAYKDILEKEVELITKFKQSFKSGLEEQTEYNKIFEKEVKNQLNDIIKSIIQKYNLNISEQQYLLSLFSGISKDTNFEDEKFGDTNWWLEEMIIKELDENTNLLETFNNLKRCSRELTEKKNSIKEQEATISELETKIDINYPDNGELTEEGFKIGNEIFKPYTYQEQPLEENYEAPDNIEIPYSIDLRSDFSKIKNQGPQGACSAFSLVSVIEYFLHKTLCDESDLSEAFVYYNARTISNTTEQDEGTTFPNIIKAIRDNGVCIEELCPYNPRIYNKKPSDEAYKEAESRKITEAKNVKLNINDIKSALAQGFPVVISAKAFTSYVKDKEGVIDPPNQTDLQDENSNHAMVICGYTDNECYFIVRNSWGSDYGDNGYCYMPYEYIRTPNAINNAYVVTGMNIKGFKAGDLPKIDSLLKGKDFNAQYSVYLNMLHETKLKLYKNRKTLDNLHKEYLNLFNQIADYSNFELTLKELKNQSDEQRKILEEKLKEIAENVEIEKKKKSNGLFGLFTKRADNNFYEAKKKEIQEKLKNLDHYADDEIRNYRIKIAILDGLKKTNHDLLLESMQMQDLSAFYKDRNERIDEQNEKDEKDLIKISRILPLKNILNQIKSSDAISIISDIGRTISRIKNGDNSIGLYETLNELQSQVMKTIIKHFELRIADYINDSSMESFFRKISNSNVMAQIHGSVPIGYGDETKYFLCNIKQMPHRIDKENENVVFLPIKDDIRMSFLHFEKYNIKDFIIFRTYEDDKEFS